MSTFLFDFSQGSCGCGRQFMLQSCENNMISHNFPVFARNGCRGGLILCTVHRRRSSMGDCFTQSIPDHECYSIPCGTIQHDLKKLLKKSRSTSWRSLFSVATTRSFQSISITISEFAASIRFSLNEAGISRKLPHNQLLQKKSNGFMSLK